MRYNKPKPGATPRPGLGLWRMEIESAEPAAKRLFVTVLTATESFKPPAPARAAFEGSNLIVHVGDHRVTFHKIRA